MKNIQYFTILILAIFLVSCGAATTEQEDKTTQNDMTSELSDSAMKALEDAEKKVKKSWNLEDLEAFWEVFSSQTENNDYLIANIGFPYGDGFKTVTKAEFSAADSEHFLTFHDTKNVTFNMLKKDGYLNGELSRLFEERFGNLDNIYFVRHEDEPAGYFAYFKVIGNNLKFIGSEDTMDASN
jgi:hypothetical protein